MDGVDAARMRRYKRLYFCRFRPHALKLRETIEPPRNWVDLGPAPPTHVVPLRTSLCIAFPQARFPELEQYLTEISDPSTRVGAIWAEYYGDAFIDPTSQPQGLKRFIAATWLPKHHRCLRAALYSRPIQ
ncbi:hypothetical protein EDB89DRAFT_2229932 [Lactarius sanguifluus]|nr:hypothetical protein EDB89DRAFT_2229932 [Lactarius sanguifluus]